MHSYHKIRIMLIGVFSFATTLFSFAQNSTDTPESTVIIMAPPSYKSDRPKTPSMQQIYCTYSDGLLSIEFSIDEGACWMSVTNQSTGIPHYYSFNSADYIEIYIGQLTQAYIEITTDRGNAYTGTIGIPYPETD